MPTTQTSLLLGLDTLSLVQLGSINKDRRLLAKASQSYAQALKDLRRALSAQDSLLDDQVLAAVMVLKVCEFYSALASERGIGWKEHVSGSQQLFAVRGPASFDSDLALELFASARHGTLCHGLITRRASIFAQPSWRTVAQRIRLKDQSSAFHDAAISIPGLLERYDSLNPQDPDHLDSIDAILAEAVNTEREMRTWLSTWAADGQQFESRPIEDFTNFATLCPDRTFSAAHTFPNFMIAYLHSNYWLCMYFLRTTVRALHTAHAIAVPEYIPPPTQVVSEEEILEYVLNLCQCIPYFCEPASATTGCIGIFLPMRTAALYFLEHGTVARARWIGSVRRTVLNKGLVPPSVDKMDLRQCGDLIADRVAAGT